MLPHNKSYGNRINTGTNSDRAFSENAFKFAQIVVAVIYHWPDLNMYEVRRPWRIYQTNLNRVSQSWKITPNMDLGLKTSKIQFSHLWFKGKQETRKIFSKATMALNS